MPYPNALVEAPGARQILNGIAREAERLHIPAFNEDKHLGLLRYAVVRCGWRTDHQVMVTLVTAQRDLPHAQEFFEAVAALNPHIVTVAQNINGRPGNAILGEETCIVYGAECMRDQLLDCEFDISPPRSTRPTRSRPSCSISSRLTAWTAAGRRTSRMPIAVVELSVCA